MRKAKYNLVAGASNGERELIVALHKSPTSQQRYVDAIALFEAAFCENLQERLMFAKDETFFEKTVPKAMHSVIGVLKNDFVLKYYPSEEEDVVAKINWEELTLPVEKGSLVAKLSLVTKLDGRLLATEELYAKHRVTKKIINIMIDEAKRYYLHLILPLLLLGGVAGFVLLTRGKDE